MQALNRILKVVGHSEAESFTKEQILSGNNKGFKGKYSGANTLLPQYCCMCWEQLL